MRKLGFKVVYETNSEGIEKTYIQDKDSDDLIEMTEYLNSHVDASTHELVRRNIFIATRNYNHRVKSFIKDVVMDKNNPMCAKYWSTKVEFQGRGAGHNHGTIWVDIDKVELSFIGRDEKWIRIDNMLEGLHGYLDMNIYYSDDEFRKQAEQYSPF